VATKSSGHTVAIGAPGDRLSLEGRWTYADWARSWPNQ